MLKLLILVTLAGVVASLGTGLYHLVRQDGSRRMAGALSLRIALSVLLFFLLFAAWKAGVLRPHGIR